MQNCKIVAGTAAPYIYWLLLELVPLGVMEIRQSDKVKWKRSSLHCDVLWETWPGDMAVSENSWSPIIYLSPQNHENLKCYREESNCTPFLLQINTLNMLLNYFCSELAPNNNIIFQGPKHMRILRHGSDIWCFIHLVYMLFNWFSSLYRVFLVIFESLQVWSCIGWEMDQLEQKRQKTVQFGDFHAEQSWWLFWIAEQPEWLFRIAEQPECLFQRRRFLRKLQPRG